MNHEQAFYPQHINDVWKATKTAAAQCKSIGNKGVEINSGALRLEFVSKVTMTTYGVDFTVQVQPHPQGYGSVLVVDGAPRMMGNPSGVPKIVKRVAAEFNTIVSTQLKNVAPESPPSSPTTSSDTSTQLSNLAQLHASGALTDAEFVAAKSRVLSGSH
jgi:hypothetical protein